jgi:hypothetical protein
MPISTPATFLNKTTQPLLCNPTTIVDLIILEILEKELIFKVKQIGWPGKTKNWEGLFHFRYKNLRLESIAPRGSSQRGTNPPMSDAS